MNTRSMIRSAAVLLAVALVVAGCGVSKSKYLQATSSADQLTAKNQELQKNLDATNAKNAELEQKVASMQSSVDQLNADLEKQKQATNEVQSTYEGMVNQLKGELSSGQVEIQKYRDGIRVNLAQDILFKSGSASLDPAGRDLLVKVAEELKNSSYEVAVVGHTDNQKIGAKLAQKYPTNVELGSARAATIVHLFESNGIGTARLLTVSAGEFRPRADNTTDEGRQLNRRIEIIMHPVEVENTASN